MDRSQEIALIERGLALVAARRSDVGDRVARLAPERYTDPAWLAREQATVFRHFPLVAGFSTQLPEAGDVLSTELAGLPVVIARAADGRLHASINACRHRGVRLLEAGCFRAKKALTCRFHGWSYEATGAFRAMPEKDGFPPEATGALDLTALPVAEHAGLVFVCPTPGPALDLPRWLGQVGDDLLSLGLGRLSMVRPTTRTRAHNWKMYVDATLESYHIPSLHASTGGAGWFARVGVFDSFGPHARAMLPEPSLLELEETDPAGWSVLRHAGFLFSIFPNTTVLVHKGIAQVMTVSPDGPGRAHLRSAMLAPTDDEAGAELRHGYYQTYWQTMEEDFEVLESMQANLQAGAVDRLLVGRQELLLTAYHAAIDAAVEGSLRP